MTTSEWISVIALAISSGGFALQARNWFMSSPRLHLSVIGDAISMPDDGRGTRVALSAVNRGTDPTMLTHMVVYIYRSWWRKYRNKPDLAGLVNSPRIPFRLDTNAIWLGEMIYSKDTTEARNKGHLYVGVIASHSNRTHLIRVPVPKEPKAPTKNIASG
jgi:hypothetical protein